MLAHSPLVAWGCHCSPLRYIGQAISHRPLLAGVGQTTQVPVASWQLSASQFQALFVFDVLKLRL